MQKLSLLSSSYIQIIAIQLKDEDQDIGASTDEKYAAENIDKDYENKEEGEAYITAEFDYGKRETFSTTFLIDSLLKKSDLSRAAPN